LKIKIEIKIKKSRFNENEMNLISILELNFKTLFYLPTFISPHGDANTTLFAVKYTYFQGALTH